MSNINEQIKQISRKLFKAKSGSVHVKRLHPKRDWALGLGIGLLIVVGVTAWNGYTYFINRDGGNTDTEITIANPRYQADVISQALDIFDTKSADFSAIEGAVLPKPIAPEVDTEIETESNTETEPAGELDADQESADDVEIQELEDSETETTEPPSEEEFEPELSL